MDHLLLGVRLLVLLGAANVAPIAVRRLFGARWNTPLDGGLRLFDGRPLLGASKTIRGLAAAVVATTVVAPLLGFPPRLGAGIGALAMLGDMLSSFAKRRLGVIPSGRATGIDQIPEALLPLVLAHYALALPWLQVAGITLAFFALEIPAAWLMFRLGLRDRPY